MDLNGMILLPKIQIPNCLLRIHTWPTLQSVGSITLMPSCPRTVAAGWQRDVTHTAQRIVSMGLVYLATFGWSCMVNVRVNICHTWILSRSGDDYIYDTNPKQCTGNPLSKSPCVLFGSLQNGSFNDPWWSELGFTDFAHQDYYIPLLLGRRSTSSFLDFLGITCKPWLQPRFQSGNACWWIDRSTQHANTHTKKQALIIYDNCLLLKSDIIHKNQKHLGHHFSFHSNCWRFSVTFWQEIHLKFHLGWSVWDPWINDYQTPGEQQKTKAFVKVTTSIANSSSM